MDNSQLRIDCASERDGEVDEREAGMNMYLERVCVRYEKCISAAGKGKPSGGSDSIGCFCFNHSKSIFARFANFPKNSLIIV